jgi:hypothetical protein
MNEMIASYLNNAGGGYLLRQTAAITVLFLLGCFIIFAVNKGRVSLFEVLLSFPVGISVYSLTVFLMLILNIKPTWINVFVIIAAGAVLLFFIFSGKRTASDFMSGKKPVFVLITVLCIAVISSSGLLPVSVSNDSLYYYSMYPSALIHFGEYRKQFNVFLTDVGQTSAMLNTLPSMLGFNEGFGIQWFLNINTLLIVIFSLKERIGENFCGTDPADKKRVWTEVIIMTGVLITSMPYVIMNRWAMSNGYFMCFMFICIYTAWRYSRNISTGTLVIQGILFTMMAFLRMEGCITAIILVLCFSTLREYGNRQLFTAFILPVSVFSLLYDIRIFYMMKIYAPYTFLTKTKAFIQLAALAAAGVYLLFIRGAVSDRIAAFLRDRFRRGHRSSSDSNPDVREDNEADSTQFIRILIPAGLAAVNVLLFLYDRALYIENMKAFAANLSNQSGWGLFPMLIISVYIMCAIVSGMGDKEIGYEDLCFTAYILTALAVSFARDDALRESIGDSGNRVMLQGTLIAFYAACIHVIGLLHGKRA